jgi:hypothetical protein
MAPSEFIATSATRANSSATYEMGYFDRFNGTSASTAVCYRDSFFGVER